MKRKSSLGGVLHAYLKYDPVRFPSPTQPPPDLITPFMNQMLAYGSMRRLTPEELAQAIKLSPEQFKNLGPSIDMIRKMLEERKRQILETYESDSVQRLAKNALDSKAKQLPPTSPEIEKAIQTAVEQEQLYDLELIANQIGSDTDPVAIHLFGLMGRLGNKYLIDELVSQYVFSGNEPMTIPQAIEIMEELEKIDELLRQLDELEETAQMAVLDMEQLGEFIDDETMHSLEEIQKTIENYVQEMAQRQGLEEQGGKFHLTPHAFRLFQGKLLDRIFSKLDASKTGRHVGDVEGEGAIEMQATKSYEFGDSLTHMDIPQTLINAMLRDGPQLPIRLTPEDIEIHRTRNNPKSATVVILDMSGSMRHDGQYINVKRMALALDGLIRSEYPGDYLGFVEMYTFGKVKRPGEIIDLMPKPVTIYDPWVQLQIDMSREGVSEHMVHQHFTNMQHALKLARQLLGGQDTPNRQIVLITDGMPTAHFEDSMLYMLYPPHPKTEEATLREAARCRQEGITINTFLIPSLSQTEEDIRFAQRLSRQTEGRLFSVSGKDLDRFVLWDYLEQKREILG